MSSPQDFDFFVGAWKVRHRRLVRRLAGCTEWQTFGGRTELRTLMGGLGNVDDNVIELPEGAYRAATLRAFDAQTKQWSIWWLDGRHIGPIDPPMRGSFDGGVGTFFADETFEGRPIRVRFLWTAGATPRWEQAFSEDGGRTWETNWEMEFERDFEKDLSPPP